MRTAFNPPRPALTLNGRRVVARPIYPSDVPVRAHEGMIAMKSSLCPGTALVKRIVVDQGRTIGFMGEEARTYATPSMILDIEHTCRDLILQHVDEGEDSVGMEVNVKHLAPTLMGMTVEVSARVAAVEGRRVVLEVAVKDDLDQVGSGTHTRFVVDKAKTFERLKAKAARVAAKPQ
jgi:fluoroacetyl-CoA thioesterase